jgi:hypothetical protein
MQVAQKTAERGEETNLMEFMTYSVATGAANYRKKLRTQTP